MKIEFPEIRRVPKNNGTELASFPIKKITITDNDCDDPQIQLHLHNQSQFDSISGQLVSMKRVWETTNDNDYIGFEILEPSERPGDKIILIKDDFLKMNLDIEKSLLTLAKMNLIHKDTSQDILQHETVRALATQANQKATKAEEALSAKINAIADLFEQLVESPSVSDKQQFAEAVIVKVAQRAQELESKRRSAFSTKV